MSTQQVTMPHPFVEQFREQAKGAQKGTQPAWLQRYQTAASEKLESLSVPGRKDEEWRFIKLDPLLKKGFVRAESAPLKLSAAELAAHRVEEAEKTTLVFLNGRFSGELSNVDGLPEGVVVTNWADFLENHDADLLSDVVGSVDYWEEDLFYNLNGAGFSDGAVVVVPRNVQVSSPVHLLYLSSGKESNFASHPRNVIVAGESSELTVVEEYVGADEGVYFTNVVNEVVVSRNATVKHYKVQRESEEAFHVARNLIALNQDANYASTAVNFGAGLSRNDSYARYDGENIDCTLDGLVHIRGNQVSDTHTAVDHRLPNSRSNQVHKVIVDERAHSVFNGKILVRQDAQVIRSYQLNQNLVLSKRAHVDTKPQLEILADDVVCTHGATVGQLSEEQFFYLLSRGIDAEQARGVLIYAFAAEVLEEIEVDSVRKRLEAHVLEATSKTAQQ